MHICKNIIVLCAMAVIAVSNCSNSAPGQKFRIGFEFQTTGSILGDNVPWEFQKVPLFEVFYKGKKLWHIEIDGGDIEFVTVPFANDKEGQELLMACAKSLKDVSEILTTYSQGKKDTTISGFIDKISSTFNTTKEVLSTETLKRVGKGIKIQKQSGWKGWFQPQVTIQMPMNKIIPLTLGLYAGTEQEARIKTAIPNSVKKSWNKCHHLDGLMFLHALTLISMRYSPMDNTRDKAIRMIGTICGVSSAGENYDAICDDFNKLLDEAESDKKTNTWLRHMQLAYWYTIDGQVDAKSSLLIMSRRPFSNMLQEITHDANTQNQVLSDKTSSDLIRKFGYVELFFNNYKTTLFDGIFYGSQFLNSSGKAVDMSHLFDLQALNRDIPYVGTWLIKNGIITMDLLRYVKLYEITKEGLQEIERRTKINNIVASIQEAPIACFIDFDEKKRIISISQSQTLTRDLLSPPILLSTKSKERRDADSMGAYDKPGSEYQVDIYGGAILEYRDISSTPEGAGLIDRKFFDTAIVNIFYRVQQLLQ